MATSIVKGAVFLKNRLRQLALRLYQRRLLNQRFASETTPDLIIMLISGEGIVSGGILSIYSFYYVTKKLFPTKTVLICTFPNRNTSLRYKWFANEVDLIDFNLVLSSKKHFKNVLLHLPEYYAQEFLESLTPLQKEQLKNLAPLHINVMNQNAELMPSPVVMSKYKWFTSNVTITTAHERYTTAQQRADYGMPMHLLSAWFEQNELVVRPYAEKKNILIVSPDEHPMKATILADLQEALPEVEQIVIRNMKYDDYKQLEALAKWSISFGEGFDGYTIFPVLKGGISFAVYNEIFFDDKYQQFETFYPSYEAMSQQLVQDIKRLDNKQAYENYSQVLRKQLEQDYSYSLYEGRVSKFYSQEYTFA